MAQMSRRSLAAVLFSYGESELAERIVSISTDEMDRIDRRSNQLIGTYSLIAACAAAAAVEVLEGAPRPLARSRRRLADAALADHLRFEPWPRDYWGYSHELIEDAFHRLGRVPKPEEL